MSCRPDTCSLLPLSCCYAPTNTALLPPRCRCAAAVELAFPTMPLQCPLSPHHCCLAAAALPLLLPPCHHMHSPFATAMPPLVLHFLMPPPIQCRRCYHAVFFNTALMRLRCCHRPATLFPPLCCRCLSPLPMLLPCCHCCLRPATATVLPPCRLCCFLLLSCCCGCKLRCCAVAYAPTAAAAGLRLPNAAAAALRPLPLRCLLKHRPAAATLPLPPCRPFAAAVLPLPILLCHRHCRAATAASALPPPLPPSPLSCRPAAPLLSAVELPPPPPTPPLRCCHCPRATDNAAALIAVAAPLLRCLRRSSAAAAAALLPCRRDVLTQPHSGF